MHGPALSKLVPPLVLLALLAGCSDGPTIQTRTVPHRDRTLAVMTLDGDAAWFLKLSGPDVFVSPLEEDFTAIAESLRVEDDTPRFDLPEGWSREDGTGMRSATLTPPDDFPVELVVTKLPVVGVEPETYVRMNYDRWRGELQLPRLSDGGVGRGREAGEIADRKIGDREATWFDLRGNIEPARMSRVLPAGDIRTGAAVLSLDLPEGWKSLGGDRFRLARFDAGQGVEVSISNARGGMAANVNRWRGQLELPPQTDQEIAAEMEPIRAGEDRGFLIRLVGGEDAADDSIVGVVVPKARDLTYFVKMTGPAGRTEAMDEAFRAFVRSLELG